MREGETLDLGEGHWLTWRVDEPHRAVDRLGVEMTQRRRVVAVVEHRSRTGKKCPIREFTLQDDVERSHLTLEAELICPVCGERCFIQGGRWMPAPEPSGWDGQED